MRRAWSRFHRRHRQHLSTLHKQNGHLIKTLGRPATEQQLLFSPRFSHQSDLQPQVKITEIKWSHKPVWAFRPTRLRCCLYRQQPRTSCTCCYRWKQVRFHGVVDSSIYSSFLTRPVKWQRPKELMLTWVSEWTSKGLFCCLYIDQCTVYPWINNTRLTHGTCKHSFKSQKTKAVFRIYWAENSLTEGY